ncbi:MAG: ABC transporter ATP-binding protein [Candidatus Altiarchaeota archaeon]|nr:ABC transporter ATP-binding protein [Candidatus Altiarchaeota archaeon]
MLTLKNVWKEYKFVNALCGVNFEVKRGELLFIMGPSGSGKSTLLHITGLLDAPTKGYVKIDGKKVPHDEDLRAKLRLKFMGFVFQDFGLMASLNALENIVLPSAIAGKPQTKRALAIAKSLGIEHRLHHYIGQLSGGEKQRVAIARALINDPQLIMADEPTGNLDSKTGLKVMGILRNLAKAGKTVVVVSHNPEHLAFADRIIHLRDGVIQKVSKRRTKARSK